VSFTSGSIDNYGKIYDVYNLYTDGDLRNSGTDAVIDGDTDTTILIGKHMEVGRDLINIDGALIKNYALIEVAGDLTNDGATIIGGHWNHSNAITTGDDDYEAGIISVAGDVININGGVINTFDRFQIDGDLENLGEDSSITAGHLAHIAGGGTYGEMIPGNDGNDGTGDWGQSMLTVEGTMTNEGTIKTIDVISVGEDIINTGTINDIYVLSVEGDVENSGTISSIADHIGVGGDMDNSGTIEAVRKIDVGGDLTNYADGVIKNIQDDISVSGLLTNAGEIEDVNSVIAGELDNRGTISTETLIVGGNASNRGDISADSIVIGGAFEMTGGEIEAGSIAVGGTFEMTGGEISANNIYAGGNITIGGDVTVAYNLTTDADLIIDSEGTFFVVQGASARSEGTVSNSGLILINAYGTLTAHDVTNAGTILLNGTLSAQTVTNNSLLAGSGMIFGGVTSNTGVINAAGGHLSPGSVETDMFDAHIPTIGSLAVKGNFTNNAGGTLDIDIIGDEVDFIRVTGGKATIYGGSVKVTTDGIEWKKGNKYYFLDTDNAGDLGVLADLTLADPDDFSVMAFKPMRDDKSYWLEVARIYEYGNIAGASVNQRNVGNYLDTIGSELVEDSPLWNFLAALDAHRAGSGDAAAKHALDELSGAVYATLGTVSVHNIGVVNTTLADTLRSDVFKFSYIGNPNNAIRGQAVAPLRYSRWATAYGIGGNSQNDGNASGYKQSFGGGIAGFDRAFWTGSRVGAYISGADGTVTMKQLRESSRSREFLIGLYLRQEMYYGYGIASFGFGQNMYKTTRNITSLGATATNRHHGDVGTAYFERGIDLPWRYGTVQPYTSFQIAAVRQKDFTEEGAEAANLELVKAQTASFRFAFGTRTSTAPIPLPFGQIALSSNLTWFHEFATDNDRDVIARLNVMGGTSATAATFQVWGNDPKQDWINLGWGGHFDRNSTRVFVGGNVYANDRQVLYTGNGGFATSW
jgi:uncharacterized protein with beta-barrel porin domain